MKQFYFCHMCVIKKTDCKLSANNGSINALSNYKIKTICYLR